MRIGVISDTHGMLRQEALTALAGVEHILHAGDVGEPEILETLRQLAPVTAIRGNIDTHGPCAKLPETEAVELGGKLFYLVHSVHDLDINPVVARVAAVVSGHSHKPGMEWRGGGAVSEPRERGAKTIQAAGDGCHRRSHSL